MKPDYAAFDKRLLQNIVAGRNTFMLLDSVSSGLLPLAEPFCNRRTSPYRIIDRRLQALRKRGLIRFDGKVWQRIVDGA